MRIIQLADIAEVHHRLGGIERAISAVRARRGARLDPTLVDILVADARTIFGKIESGDAWPLVIDALPAPKTGLTQNEFDLMLDAIADFVDVRSPYLSGHSRGVAALAERTALVRGLQPSDATQIRRAALVHDVGRLGISNAVWDKRGPLTMSEWEHVRLHPYLSERILTRPHGLERLALLAGRHHERLDGTGYPHGLAGASLEVGARILAVADSYHALREPRPHRSARSDDDAARLLRAEARVGRLDAAAVDAVLQAAGHRTGARRAWPAGLTEREAEILALIATGSGTADAARALGITTKTMRNHLDHIYAKLGVQNRTGAVLFAIASGLTGHFPHPPMPTVIAHHKR